MPDWARYLEANRPRFLQDLSELLRIPSISALPEYAPDVQRAAEWVAGHLRSIGIEDAQVMPTGGHPIVFGSWLGAPGKPTALIYGHFDVQPVDPLDQWTSPPFEPTVRDGRLYARGASDNKGNFMAALVGVEALLQAEGRLPINVKFLLEGQEEVGSPQLHGFIPAHRDLLACDFALNADSGQWSETEPSLAMGVRGICLLEMTVRGPKSDLHSGGFGGAVQNPLHALAEIIAGLHAPDGSIAVEGFYDDVAVLTPEERNAISSVPYDEEEFKAQAGVEELWGEAGYTTLERLWVRPTLEVNGMWGGFQGQGFKTVLPAEAHAKVSCRLVPDQDPQRALAALVRHLQAHVPPGVQLELRPRPANTRPYSVPADHPANQAVRDVLVALYGREPYRTRAGGSVPVLGIMLEHLGIYSIGFGFALHDERAHAPNEFFRLSSFERGQEGWCRLLERLAQ
ncbi:MAG: dipeptidase [Anaerolineae bacterium]|nr:dipeptidase [Anaerolineae bacterium]